MTTSKRTHVSPSRAVTRLRYRYQYINSREVSCEIRLEPNAYTLLPSTFKPGQEAPFWLTVHSDAPVRLEPIDPSVEAC